MKYFLIIILTLFSFVGVCQSRTKQIRDSIDVLIPLDKQIKASDLRKALKNINDKTEIVRVEPPVYTSIPKGRTGLQPVNGRGGYATNLKVYVGALPLATSYDLQISQDGLFTTPTLLTQSLTTFNVVGLDSNKRYYRRYRGRSVSQVGAWSDIESFDTFRKPLYASSVYSLIPFDVNEVHFWNYGLAENQDYETAYGVGTNVVYFRHIKKDVTNFPLTVHTGVSQVLQEYQTLNWTTFSWGEDSRYLDVAPFTNIVAGDFVMQNPNQTFPVYSINFYSTIFYLKP
jgi:hypothetical protein